MILTMIMTVFLMQTNALSTMPAQYEVVNGGFEQPSTVTTFLLMSETLV
jgi:hypothetical protein